MTLYVSIDREFGSNMTFLYMTVKDEDPQNMTKGIQYESVKC